MSFANKLESTYLSILRYVILVGATIALVIVGIAGLLALGSILSSEPAKPTATEFSERVSEYKKDFSLGAFRNDSAPKSVNKEESKQQEQPVPKEDSFQKSGKDNADKIAQIIVKYQQQVFNQNLDQTRVAGIILNIPRNNGLYNKDVQKFYFETLLDISNQVDKEIPEVAKDSTKEFDIQKLVDWHLAKVRAETDKLDAENQEKIKKYQESVSKYLEKKAALAGYVSLATSAFGVFLAIIWTLLLVKIELNLRPIKEFSDSKKSS